MTEWPNDRWQNKWTYQLAVKFYQECKTIKLEAHLKNQLNRASSSIALNLAEGAGRSSKADTKRFYQIALGSLRESQAILDINNKNKTSAYMLADKLGANLFCLIKKTV